MFLCSYAWNKLIDWLIKYLGHIIEHTLYDDSDINLVKVRLFRTYCLCFNDMSLWKHYKVGTMNKQASAYIKWIKILFGYAKFSSVTVMLLELGLPCFSTVLHNARVRLTNRLNCSVNSLVRNISCIWRLTMYMCFFSAVSFLFLLLFIVIVFCVCVCACVFVWAFAWLK